MVFDSIETFVLFFFVWYVCVVVGHRMIVWQRSYQVKCARRKSRDAIVERCATMQISSVDFFGFQFSGRLWKIGFRSMSQWKYKRICCAIYSRKQNFHLRVGFDG
jgi:hypothetical protein